jgi:hypothetical protein
VEKLQGTNGEVYALGERIGEGGFGVTRQARRERDGQTVVVKQLRLERLEDWKAIELFEREARVLEELDHASIPDYLDFVPLGDAEAPEGFALVQQFVPGFTLQECVGAGRQMEVGEAYRWFVRMLEVLEYLHGLDPPVIHRDITPKNIIIGEDGEAYLIDFGTVQAAIVSATAVGSTSAGTFGYAPMEQFVGRATPASDLYSLGVTFASVLMGEPPERMPFENAHLDVAAALSGFAVDARLRLELEKMVLPDPSRRAQSAAEVLANLGHLLDAPAAPIASALAPRTDGEPEGEGAPWQRAYELLERVGPLAMWNPTPRVGYYEFDVTSVSPDGRWLMMLGSYGTWCLDLGTMELVMRDHQDWTSPVMAWAPGGQGCIVIDTFRDRSVLFEFGKDGPGERHTFGECAVDRPEVLALSPDLELLAGVGTWSEGQVVLMNPKTGEEIRVLQAGAELDAHIDWGSVRIDDLCFSPDGRLLVASASRASLVYDTQGETAFVDSRRVAFSMDGRVAVHTPYGKRRVCIVRDLDTSTVGTQGLSAKDVLVDGVEDAANLRLSPDGSLLAFTVEDEEGRDEVVVVDVATGEEVWRPEPPYSGGRAYDDVNYAAFTPDGRLCVDAESEAAPWCAFDDEDDGLVHVASLSERAYLGTIRLIESNDAVSPPRVYVDGVVANQGSIEDLPEHLRDAYRPRIDADHDLVGLTPEGFIGMLDERKTTRKKGKRATHLERRDLVRARLSGARLEELLDEDEVALARDLDLRRRFFTSARAEGVIASACDVHTLTMATRGLTPWLPHLLEAAREVDSGVAGFGVKQDTTGVELRENQLLKAIAELGARDADQRRVLFEDQARAFAERDAAARAERQRQLEREEMRRLPARAVGALVRRGDDAVVQEGGGGGFNPGVLIAAGIVAVTVSVFTQLFGAPLAVGLGLVGVGVLFAGAGIAMKTRSRS